MLYKGDVLLGLTAQVSQNTAVGVEDLAIDKVRGMRGQEHGRAYHILCLTPAACRGLSQDELVKGMAAAIGLGLTQGAVCAVAI